MLFFNIDTSSLPNYSRLLTTMVGREGDALVRTESLGQSVNFLSFYCHDLKMIGGNFSIMAK